MSRRQFQPVIKMPPGERRSRQLRHFLAAVGRYRPLLVVSLGPIGRQANSDEEPTLPLLVVTDGTLSWATVDRLSDGEIEATVYSQEELLNELRLPGSTLAEAVAKGSVLYGPPTGRLQLLAGEPISTPAVPAEAVRT